MLYELKFAECLVRGFNFPVHYGFHGHMDSHGFEHSAQHHHPRLLKKNCARLWTQQQDSTYALELSTIYRLLNLVLGG